MRRFFGRFKRDATELDSNLTPVTTTTTSTATAAAATTTTTASTVSTATSVNNTRKYKKKGSKSDLTLDEFDAVPAPFSGSLQRGELIPLQLKQLRDEQQQQQQQAEKEEGVAEKQEDAVMADVTYGEVATTTTTTATTTVTATSDDEDDEGKEEQFHACLEETSPELGNCALLPDDDVTSSTSTSAVPSDSSSSSSTEQTSIQQRQQEPFQNNNMISTNNDDNNNDNSNNNDDAISTDNAPPPRSPSWRMMHTKSASSSTLVFSKRISIAVDLERPSLIQRFKNARQSTALKRNSQCMVSHNPLYASASASVSSDDSGSGSGGGHDVSIDDIYSIRRAIQEADAAAAAAAAAAPPPAAGGGGGGGKEGQPQRQQQLAAPAATPAEEAPITIQAPSLGVSGSSDPDDVGEISSKSKEIRRSIRLQIDKKIKESADTAGTPSSGGGGGVGSPRGQPPKRRSLRMSIQITISAERFSAVNAELDMILRCKEKRDVLREHCRKERSEENLNFWECIENEWYPVAHKLTLSERRQLANKIYQEFVPWSSPQPLNLSQSAVNRIWRQLESPHPITVDIFDEAKRDVEINMLDSFHRFRRTQLYADLIAGKLNNNNNNNCNSNNDGNNNNNNGLTIPPAAAAAAASSVEKEKKKFLSEFLAAVVNYKAPKATSLLKKTASRKSIFFKHWQSGGSNSSNGNYGNDSDKQSRRRSLMPLRSEDLRTASELLRGLEELGSEKYAEIAAYYEARKELEEAAVAVVKSPASSAAAPAFPSSAADHKLT